MWSGVDAAPSCCLQRLQPTTRFFPRAFRLTHYPLLPLPNAQDAVPHRHGPPGSWQGGGLCGTPSHFLQPGKHRQAAGGGKVKSAPRPCGYCACWCMSLGQGKRQRPGAVRMTAQAYTLTNTCQPHLPHAGTGAAGQDSLERRHGQGLRGAIQGPWP